MGKPQFELIHRIRQVTAAPHVTRRLEKSCRPHRRIKFERRRLQTQRLLILYEFCSIMPICVLLSVKKLPNETIFASWCLRNLALMRHLLVSKLNFKKANEEKTKHNKKKCKTATMSGEEKDKAVTTEQTCRPRSIFYRNRCCAWGDSNGVLNSKSCRKEHRVEIMSHKSATFRQRKHNCLKF